jgi:hypothetical protein
MKGRKTSIGLCLLCALAVSAFAAQSASAITGTTAFTCKKTAKGGVGFSAAHCATGDAVASGASFEHVAIEEGLKTELSGTNANTASGTTAAGQIKLKNNLSGIEYEIVAAKVSGIGSVTNQKAANGEHYVHGTAVVVFEEVVITKPAGKGCKVGEAKIESNLLAATSQGQGDTLKFQPAEGTALTSYNIEGCSVGGLNGKQTVTGSINCPLNGATITCTHTNTTEQGTLKEGGSKSGIEGAMTLKARTSGTEEELTPLSATTVTT